MTAEWKEHCLSVEFVSSKPIADMDIIVWYRALLSFFTYCMKANWLKLPLKADSERLQISMPATGFEPSVSIHKG